MIEMQFISSCYRAPRANIYTLSSLCHFMWFVCFISSSCIFIYFSFTLSLFHSLPFSHDKSDICTGIRLKNQIKRASILNVAYTHAPTLSRERERRSSHTQISIGCDAKRETEYILYTSQDRPSIQG